MRLFLAALVVLPLAVFAQGARPDTNRLLAEARQAEATHELPAADRAYAELVSLHPKDAEFHAAYGSVLALEGKDAAAIVEWKAALPGTGRKQQPALMLAIGKAYMAQAAFREARIWLQSALDMQPRTIAFAVSLAEVDLNLGEPEAAVAVLAPRATLTTRDIPFMDIYGRALIATGKLGEGAEMLEHVAQTTNDAETYKLAGTTFLADDDFASARRNLEFARKINPRLTGLDVPLATARERSGDAFAAEAVFRDEVRADPGDFAANLYLGTLLYRHRKAAEAKGYLDRALAIRPEDALAQCEAAALRARGSCALAAL